MWKKIFITSLASILILALFAGNPAYLGAEEKEDEDKQEEQQKEQKSKLQISVDKGIEYLKSQQQADGQWVRGNGPFQLNIPMNEGTTALVLFTLLKCGVKPNDPAIVKGFDFVRKAGFNHVYAVACLCMALDALYSSPHLTRKKEKDDGDPLGTTTEDKPDPRGWRKAAPSDIQLFKDAIAWLVSKQEPGPYLTWRYPSPQGDGTDGQLARSDASNSQYVALAFSAARRVNQVFGRRIVSIPPKVFAQMLDYYIRDQEKDGPKVDPFVVPGADHSMRELSKYQKKFRKRLTKARKEEKKKKMEAGDLTTGVIQEAQDKIFGGEAKPMKARGWCYMKGSKMAWRTAITGAMTTSGIISCLVAKAWLEDLGAYRPYQKNCDQAIRDGCAWVCKNFTVSRNPVSSGQQSIHHYYYLYGLERAGMLGMVYEFGRGNDWYEKGSKLILSQQGADGGWKIGSGTVGPVVDTCFALLFLKRATTPLIELPQPTTGGDILGK